MSARVLSIALALALALPQAAARSQDFAPAAPAGPQPGAASLLERALPREAAIVSLETVATRWLSFSSLETRAASLLLAPGAARVALGISQTGDPELGWTAAGLAAGIGAREGGIAVRAIARRDRAEGALRGGDLTQGAGLELGAGAWLAPTPRLACWATAPQLFTSGATPPLQRPLEIGARVTADDMAAWAYVVAPRPGDDGERCAGLALGPASANVWAEGRDAPLRASLGARARVRALAIEARVDAHPVLGETTRLSLAWRPREPGAGR